EGPKNAIVRRWIAPIDGAVTISGVLEHPSESGNGVRGHIISSRIGTLGFWPVHDGKRAMSIPRVEVKKGDTIDFVVDSNGDLASESFNWAPSIKALWTTAGAAEWKAKEGFSGPVVPAPPLGPWEELAQVLLMSIELGFVD